MEQTLPFSLIENRDAPAMPSNLKIINRFNILKCFRDGMSHTVSEVSAITGISKNTSMRAVHFFCEKGILVTQGKFYQGTIGGKYPEIFKLNIMKYILDITLWPHIVCFTLMDFCGNVVKRTNYGAVKVGSLSVAEINEFLREETVAFLEEEHITREDVYGVWVSTAGNIDYTNNRIKYNAQAPEWGSDVSLLDSLKEYFNKNTKIFLENGGKTIARAFLHRPEVGNKRVLIITTDGGISGCFMQDGKIVSGQTSLIGEIGHMIIDEKDWEKCNCGSYGCLERMVDIKRIRHNLKNGKIPENSRLNTIPLEELTLQQLFEIAGEGDETAKECVTYLADCFALALRNILLVFDPELVAFVGDYAHAGTYFNQRMKDKLKEFKYCTNDALSDILYEKKSMIELDNMGAAVAVADYYFDNMKIYEEG